MSKIAIVGGGISGLAAAYTLQKSKREGKDIDFVLIEKGQRAGGQIVTEKVDGFTIEGGPDCFIVDKPWALQLANELGIGDRLQNTNEQNSGTFILSNGKLHPLPEGVTLLVPTKFFPFVTSGLFSWPGKIRMGMDLFIPRRKEVDDESLAGFVRRRLGQEALDKLAEPLIGGIHASDPEKMSVMSTFPRLVEMEKKNRSLILAALEGRRKMKAMPKRPGPKRTFFISFAGGMQELIDTLANAIDSEHVLCGKEVVSMEKLEMPPRPRYKLHFQGGDSLEVDAVIFAALAFNTADLIGRWDRVLAEKLRVIPHVDSATISLGFKASDVGKLKGYGFIVPLAEGRNLMATTFSSQKWANRAPEGYVLMRGFVGGAHHKELVGLDDDSLVNLVLKEWKDILGLEAKPVLSKVFRWYKSMPQYTVGHLDRLAEIEGRAAQHDGLFLCGASYRGVGIPDCVNKASMAAEKAIEYLGQLKEAPRPGGRTKSAKRKMQN